MDKYDQLRREMRLQAERRAAFEARKREFARTWKLLTPLRQSVEERIAEMGGWPT